MFVWSAFFSLAACAKTVFRCRTWSQSLKMTRKSKIIDFADFTAFAAFVPGIPQ